MPSFLRDIKTLPFFNKSEKEIRLALARAAVFTSEDYASVIDEIIPHFGDGIEINPDARKTYAWEYMMRESNLSTLVYQYIFDWKGNSAEFVNHLSELLGHPEVAENLDNLAKMRHAYREVGIGALNILTDERNIEKVIEFSEMVKNPKIREVAEIYSDGEVYIDHKEHSRVIGAFVNVATFVPSAFDLWYRAAVEYQHDPARYQSTMNAISAVAKNVQSHKSLLLVLAAADRFRQEYEVNTSLGKKTKPGYEIVHDALIGTARRFGNLRTLEMVYDIAKRSEELGDEKVFVENVAYEIPALMHWNLRSRRQTNPDTPYMSDPDRMHFLTQLFNTLQTTILIKA